MREIMSGRSMGKSQKMRMAVDRYMREMKPGEKACIVTADDTIVIGRNPDQIGPPRKERQNAE